jgi:uncharacterized integral membrane protein (TIGR00698 family)
MIDVKKIAPGAALAAAVAAAAWAGQCAESMAFARAPVEAVALAILLGSAVRTLWRPSAVWTPGLRFSGHELLEFAVMLLGASIGLAALRAAGPALLAGIVATVAISIASSYSICRLMRLTPKMAVLVACGNSICGNSAIAAVAPVIGANEDDIASAVAFTAFLGSALVLCLPLLAPVLRLDHAQYGVFAGMTAYAVPQVLAATLPVSAVSSQIGAIVKLARVMMLGPVVLFFSIAIGRARTAKSGEPIRARVPLAPWFIIGFAALALARSFGAVPTDVVQATATTANLLTIVAMAALGLSVDLRDLRHAGMRATSSVIGSLAVLAAISLCLIHFVGPT